MGPGPLYSPSMILRISRLTPPRTVAGTVLNSMEPWLRTRSQSLNSACLNTARPRLQTGVWCPHIISPSSQSGIACFGIMRPNTGALSFCTCALHRILSATFFTVTTPFKTPAPFTAPTPVRESFTTPSPTTRSITRRIPISTPAAF